MDTMPRILNEGFAELGLSLPDGAAEKFRDYYELIEAGNRVANLTAITGVEDAARLHFLDCAAILKVSDLTEKTVIDVGSGAGFPGIPMKIACPSMALTLLDSRLKRVDFLEDTVRRLNLDGTVCIQARAEEASRGALRESFDVAVARAVSRLNVLCELCLPFVKLGGIFAAMKGPDWNDEVSESRSAVEKLGGAVSEIFEYAIPGTTLRRSVVLIVKNEETPTAYPRRMARIKKAPL